MGEAVGVLAAGLVGVGEGKTTVARSVGVGLGVDVAVLVGAGMAVTVGGRGVLVGVGISTLIETAVGVGGPERLLSQALKIINKTINKYKFRFIHFP